MNSARTYLLTYQDYLDIRKEAATRSQWGSHSFPHRYSSGERIRKTRAAKSSVASHNSTRSATSRYGKDAG